MGVEGSILDTMKKTLGIAADYDVFDEELKIHINSVLAVLAQVGVGAKGGFAVVDGTETWQDFLGDNPEFNNVKSLVYLRVRLLFDPPQSSHATAAMKEQAEELTWRVNVRREEDEWKLPLVVEVDDD